MTRTGVLVMSHGTPRSLDELPAFYTEIRRGRPPPPELLDDLARRYEAIGGTSPLNERTRAQVDGIRRALESRAEGRFVVASGAKFAPPRIEDAVAALAEEGVRLVTGLVLTPHYSSASVGEYARRAREAAASVVTPGGGFMTLDMIDQWHLTPGFVGLVAERVRRALGALPEGARAGTIVVFSAHSVPTRLIDAGDPYAAQVHESAAAVADAAGIERWTVAWQSAGRTDDTWLAPDVGDAIASLSGTGATGVVVCPIGFVSDHLEVLYDIDVEARAAAGHAGLPFARTASLNDDPRFCEELANVVTAAAGAPRP